jgi:hypothetical protein
MPDNQIYIIAAKDDKPVAKQLYDDLKNVGLNVWMESEDLDVGGNVDLIVRKNIRNSAYIIAVLSSHAISKRGLVHKELKLALDVFDECPPDSIFLIPVRIDDCEIYEPRLESLKAVDLSESYQDGLRQILKSIEKQGILKPKTSEPEKPVKKIDSDLKNKVVEIERLYEDAEFRDAYRKFKELCSSYPSYKDQAVSFLASFSDLNNQIMQGIIPFEQQMIAKQQIGSRFMMCLKRFKEDILAQG